MRLKLQFIALLLIVALLPSIPVAFTVHALFRRTLDPVLEADLLGGAEAGLDAVRELLEREKQTFDADVRRGANVDTLATADVATLSGRDRAALENLAARTAPSRRPVLIPPERLTLQGREVLVARVVTDTDRPIWVLRALDPTLTTRAARLGETVRLVETLRRERDSVLRSLVLSFLLVYGVTLVVVVLLALSLAARVTRPVAALTAGIQRVASGDLDTRVPIVAGGKMGELLVSFNDMVARTRDQQSDLLRLEKLAAWRQMARRLAHEIKNPLTPIQLAAQQMRDAYSGRDEAYQGLLTEGTGIIEEEVETLRGLVTEFSQFARMPDPKREVVSIAGLFADVRALYGDRITSGPTPESLRVMGDPEQLHRVLINLVNNGLQAQAGRSEEPVSIIAIERNGNASIQVCDRGPGVPVSERKRIFEPDVTTKSDGMGLGLAIVEATIEAHGGSIAVDDAPGGGARFQVTLPLANDQNASEVPE